MSYILAAVLIYALDQGSKVLIRSHMMPGDQFSVIHGLLSIHYIQNQGAAFGILSSSGRLLEMIPIVVILAVLIVVMINKYMHPFCKYALIMVAAGGLGNLTDRVLFGRVTDMISFSFFPPIFNVADIAITTGCMMIAVYVLFGERFRRTSGSRRRR
ncbi:MAG: signal peptidase II [Eubacterium sp.]|jgi:signal peptidase II|nr:signal peptidase II [Eubacterium sp.]MCH4046400.1 signal peptidase II [Eubacterium sp.]MCH4079495.1 signal peptidase II [Eubacterium sp.]MCH4111087.1 signal peptidase II [Eubacterium sp.]MCI1307924.1 signal peptidase II [Eubacterium sp.]